MVTKAGGLPSLTLQVQHESLAGSLLYTRPNIYIYIYINVNINIGVSTTHLCQHKAYHIYRLDKHIRHIHISGLVGS